MENPQVYILISIIALFMIMAVLIFTREKMKRPLSKAAAIAFAFVLAGIIFSESRLVAYSLMGTGVAIAILDIIKKSFKNN